jgi:hypothetical protein
MSHHEIFEPSWALASKHRETIGTTFFRLRAEASILVSVVSRRRNQLSARSGDSLASGSTRSTSSLGRSSSIPWRLTRRAIRREIERQELRHIEGDARAAAGAGAGGSPAHGSILHAPRLVVPGTASWVGNTTVVVRRAARRLRPPSFRAPRLLFRAAVIPLVSIALASLWLALAITIASAGAASASADDSRLLPSGPRPISGCCRRSATARRAKPSRTCTRPKASPRPSHRSAAESSVRRCYAARANSPASPHVLRSAGCRPAGGAAIPR